MLLVLTYCLTCFLSGMLNNETELEIATASLPQMTMQRKSYTHNVLAGKPLSGVRSVGRSASIAPLLDIDTPFQSAKDIS